MLDDGLQATHCFRSSSLARELLGNGNAVLVVRVDVPKREAFSPLIYVAIPSLPRKDQIKGTAFHMKRIKNTQNETTRHR